VDFLGKGRLLLIRQRRNAVNASRPFALVILGHPANRKDRRASGCDQESLKLVDRLRLAST
jgi:hypothetical protein